MRTVTFAILAFTLVFASQESIATDPGFRTQITQNGLNYLTQVGVPLVVQQLQNMQIPDISGKASTPIGHIEYSLKQITLQSFTVPSASIQTLPNVGLQVSTSGVSGHLHADWHYKTTGLIPVSDSGSLDASLSSVSASVSASFGSTSDGHPSVSAAGCSTNIGKISVDFHGGASWLYNLFDSQIESSIKSSLNDQLCGTIKSAINSQGNQALSTLPVVEPIDDISEINFALIESPTFSDTYLDTAHKGEFFYIKNPTECPFTPAPTPATAGADRMMYVWLTSYMIDSAGFAYLQSGELEYILTPDQVPSGFPLSLNTTSFKLILPQLYNFCPGCAMQVVLNCTTPAHLDISPSGLILSVYGDMDVQVMQNNVPVEAFTLATTILANGNVFLFSANGTEFIGGNTSFIGVNITLQSSAIGLFDPSLLQDAVNLIAQYGVIPLLNSYIVNGFEIPTIGGMSFVNPEIVLGDGYVQVDTDVVYNPSAVRSPPQHRYVKPAPKIVFTKEDYIRESQVMRKYLPVE